jgi:hypothetical protein
MSDRPIKWELARRLDYIDWRIITRGFVRRQHLMETFGVSEAQASADLATFREMFPDALGYDLSAKKYVPADGRYRTRRGWTAEALEALGNLARAKHQMAWGE